MPIPIPGTYRHIHPFKSCNPGDHYHAFSKKHSLVSKFKLALCTRVDIEVVPPRPLLEYCRDATPSYGRPFRWNRRRAVRKTICSRSLKQPGVRCWLPWRQYDGAVGAFPHERALRARSHADERVSLGKAVRVRTLHGFVC